MASHRWPSAVASRPASPHSPVFSAWHCVFHVPAFRCHREILAALDAENLLYVPLFSLWLCRISVLFSCSLHNTQHLIVDVDKPMCSVIEFRRCARIFFVVTLFHEMLHSSEITLHTLSCSLLSFLTLLCMSCSRHQVPTRDRQGPFSCTESWAHHVQYLLQGWNPKILLLCGVAFPLWFVPPWLSTRSVTSAVYSGYAWPHRHDGLLDAYIGRGTPKIYPTERSLPA